MSFSENTEVLSNGKKVEFLYPIYEIDSFNGEELGNHIAIKMEKVDVFVINFSRVTYLNSSGLRELIRMLRVIKESEKSLILTSINEDIKKVFMHTNLDRLFAIEETDENVIATLSAE